MRILTFVHIVYQTVTVQFTQYIIATQEPTVYPRNLLGQCDTFHWQLKTVEQTYWRVVSSISQLNAGLLWFWRLTIPALCCIVQLYTDVVRQRGETCWKFWWERKVKGLMHPANQQANLQVICRHLSKLVGQDQGRRLMVTEVRCFRYLEENINHEICTVFVIRDVMTVQVTGNCDRIYKKPVRFCKFPFLPCTGNNQHVRYLKKKRTS